MRFNKTPASEKPPFIGKKQFETRPGISGTGTPVRFVEIDSMGNVMFSFIQENQGDAQENQGDGTTTDEVYKAGKFQKYMKCVFAKWDDEVRYYEITKDIRSRCNE